ncbi:HD domain-containing protein [hot springs metagenome]|uniref:HD domain-containing protein n=1 Tax=hot springs metagenome TaxID=433727 RepID=A0A5J4L5C2_9ZZZZ
MRFFFFMVFIAGISYILYALYSYFSQKSRKNSSQPLKEIITLEELSKIWMEPVHDSHDINANNENKTIPEKTEEINIEYQHQRIRDFYLKHIADKPHFFRLHEKIARKLLEILDREGDCPSVVNTFNEDEGKLPKDVYDILARTTLLEHTLNVAEKMIELLGGSGPLISKAVITALAHDLGKIPSHRKLYATGDHPLVSIGLLNQIEVFNALSDKDKDEIFKAIKDHHRNSDEFLCIKLKKADQAARRKELAEKLPEPASLQQETFTDNTVKEDYIIPAFSTEAENTKAKPSDTDIFGSSIKPEREKVTITEQDLPWFDPDEYLGELNPYINRLNGGRWDAFSMSNGYVYFQVKILWEVAKKIARQKGHTEVLLGDADESMRQNILFSIVNRLRTDKDVIARGLIQDKYFGAPFVVIMRDGKKFDKGYYTPFVAEAFASTVSELEARKVGRLKDIVDVSPKFD